MRLQSYVPVRHHVTAQLARKHKHSQVATPYHQLLLSLLCFTVMASLDHYHCKTPFSHYASDTTTHVKTSFKEKKGGHNSIPRALLPIVLLISTFYSWKILLSIKCFPYDSYPTSQKFPIRQLSNDTDTWLELEKYTFPLEYILLPYNKSLLN